jgi:U3 small nucleolar RNA-associated protein 14
MEAEIQKILGDGGLSEQRQLELEEMEMNKLSKEEVATRRAELAKMRSLMFFQEQKRKKVAKIKSKTYRKLNKKKSEEDPDEMDIQTLKSLDPEAARERLITMERERAVERMTLKHKNSGKWAKKMKGRSVDSEVCELSYNFLLDSSSINGSTRQT